jgi:hypothetical protein
MPGEIKKDEQKQPEVNLSAADREVIDFAAKEEAEADRILAEALGQAPKKKDEPQEPVKEPEKIEVKEPENKPEPKEPLDDNKGLNPKVDEDLLADLTVDNAKKRISAAQAKMHESNKMAKTATEEATNLVKENADLRALVEQAATQEPAKAPEGTAPEPTATVESDEEVEKSLETLRQEYPEIAEPMVKLLHKQQTQNKILTDKLNGIESREQKRDADAKQVADNAHLTAISTAHPDFREISAEPLLDEWINALPVMEKIGAQAIRKDGDTNDVIELLTTFKKANGYVLPDPTPEADKVDSKLEKAKKMATPSLRKAKEVNITDKKVKFTQDEISKWSEAEWAANEAAVDEALKEGLVV